MYEHCNAHCGARSHGCHLQTHAGHVRLHASAVNATRCTHAYTHTHTHTRAHTRMHTHVALATSTNNNFLLPHVGSRLVTYKHLWLICLNYPPPTHPSTHPQLLPAPPVRATTPPSVCCYSWRSIGGDRQPHCNSRFLILANEDCLAFKQQATICKQLLRVASNIPKKFYSKTR